ncbi:galectin-1-like isoform X1 [Pagrus major]|uniref:galectin-1-like isoform X1 n=2 Tax=Pagrus major TaxID=143350 RepID=UPI003CC84345
MDKQLLQDCSPTPASNMNMQLELNNVNLRAGDQLKVKGMIQHDAERFQIDLGCDADDLALHFNPRFHDDADGSVLVCNSKTDGCWGEEKREIHNPLQRGTDVKIVLKLAGDMFEVELPDGQEVQFPNRDSMDVISYVKIAGDFKLTSFKIC